MYRTVEELYADPAVDAIYITTPHNTHIEYLRGALAAGKHVLCEKAITLNSDELAEARAIADEHHVVLMDATTVLHMPLYVELMRRARAGEFGRLRLAQVNLYLRGALSAGKHVLCEKAITLNSDELVEARAIADEHHVVLMDATTVLHMPLYVELMRRARAGEFGRLRLAQVNFGSFHDYEDVQSRFWNRSLAGGAMLDIGVYALSVARLFMESQPDEVVSLANLFKTGVDEESGFITRNAQGQLGVFSLTMHAKQPKRAGQLGVFSLTMHAKQPKRADLCFDDCYVEIMAYPRADRATITWTADGRITWTADGRREEVTAGVEAYALCYEIADLEKAVAGDESKLKLIDYASDVMETMTRLRRDWGVVYPEEE